MNQAKKTNISVAIVCLSTLPLVVAFWLLCTSFNDTKGGIVISAETPREALRSILIASSEGDFNSVMNLSCKEVQFELASITNAQKDRLSFTANELLKSKETSEIYFEIDLCYFNFSEANSIGPSLVFEKIDKKWLLREWSNNGLISSDVVELIVPDWLREQESERRFNPGSNESPQVALFSFLWFALEGSLEHAIELVDPEELINDCKYNDASILQKSAMALLTSGKPHEVVWNKREHCFEFEVNGNEPCLLFREHDDGWRLHCWDDMGLIPDPSSQGNQRGRSSLIERQRK